MRKKCFLLLSFVFWQAICTKNVVQMSMPKAGTHLLMKCISSLTGIARNQIKTASAANYWAFYQVSPDEFQSSSQQEKYWMTHLFFNEAFEPFLNNEKNAFFFIYRDPRDQLVSFAHFMLKVPRWSEKASKLSFDELLLELIQSGEIYNNAPPCENIADLYQHYMPWCFAPNVCSIRFEDLIGPKGGGNLEAQIETIKKIADHLDITITDAEVRNKADILFGGTVTFRKGQIGSWKNYFKEYHKKAFKEIAGQLLIDLGYEKDFSW